MSELIEYIAENLVMVDYGSEYSGISEPNTTQLFILKGLIEQQLFILRNNATENNLDTDNANK